MTVDELAQHCAYVSSMGYGGARVVTLAYHSDTGYVYDTVTGLDYSDIMIDEVPDYIVVDTIR
jgi:hypothetical protein